MKTTPNDTVDIIHAMLGLVVKLTVLLLQRLETVLMWILWMNFLAT
jgi:hypothetical protein